MAKNPWTVPCTRSILDRDTGQISLIDVAESLTAHATEDEFLRLLEEKPNGIAPVGLEVVSYWVRDDVEEPERATGRVQILGPDDAVCMSGEFEIDLTAHRNLKVRLNVGAFPVARGLGMYRLETQLKSEGDEWIVTSSMPLEFKLADPD